MSLSLRRLSSAHASSARLSEPSEPAHGITTLHPQPRSIFLQQSEKSNTSGLSSMTGAASLWTSLSVGSESNLDTSEVSQAYQAQNVEEAIKDSELEA